MSTIHVSISTPFIAYIVLNDQTVLFQLIQFSIRTVQMSTIHVSISTQFIVYTQLNDQTVLFPTIQFSISTKLNGFTYCYESQTIKQ